jgi:hypothetical protein
MVSCAAKPQCPPQKLISQGTDWRVLDQLKRELKT